jgi:uncharacterized protein (AIM24 family)
MSDSPRLMPTSCEAETFGGVTYHIDGDLVPVLTVDVSERAVYFAHHLLLWKHPSVRIAVRPAGGLFKRMAAGAHEYVTQASGAGQIAFSRDGAGRIVPIHLAQGRELHAREHQFLAATDAVDYTFERVRGATSTMHGEESAFIEKFHSRRGDGILWLHGCGNVFEKALGCGEAIDIEPSGWLYKDATVRIETRADRLENSGLAGAYIVVNRFIGPGRVGIQSMSLETH